MDALEKAEQLVREAEKAADRKDPEIAVRCAWEAVRDLKRARDQAHHHGDGEEGRNRRSPLYVRAVQAAARAERWADARKMAAHVRYDRDARRSDRATLGKVVERANQALQIDQPRPECDLVMKGGITSGIVYPRALRALSEKYTFRCIGGASVGAVAAAAAAAAEYSRRHFPGPEVAIRGFPALEKLPDELGATDEATGHSKLLSLFQPQPETRPALELVLAVLGGRTAIGKALGAVTVVLKSRPLPFLLFALLAALLVWGAAGADQALLLTLAVLAAFATLGLGVIASAAALAVGLNRSIASNWFGICRGFSTSPRGPEELSTWLTNLLNRVAGLPYDHPPLTFGDLHGDDPKKRIELVVMTTNLTFGRPYRLPFLADVEKGGKTFFFNVHEMAEFFPTGVVDLLQAAGEARLREPELVRKWGDRLRAFQAEGYYPFPRAASLPVVVAVRMSLSFPVLVSMVPLYSVDETLEEGAPRLERCWFSDGGACSNLPIHFFDALMPTRPTFAINLVGETPNRKVDPTDQAKNVWMPSNNLQGLSEQWSRFASRPSLVGFFRALIGTMQNWVDGMQITAPGYRDRIVHIRHTSGEGGLNLNMEPDVIRRMSLRGEKAGERIVDDFDWDNHVWIRLRSVLDISDSALSGLAQGLLADPARRALIQRLVQEHTGAEVPEDNAPISASQAAELAALFAHFEELVKAKRESYSDEAAPDPTPELRVRPKL